MTEYRRVVPRSASERVYRALLRAYPKDFRDEFGDAMVEFFRDRLARARRDATTLGRTRVWLRVGADLLTNALPAQVDTVVRRVRRHRDQREALRASPSLVSFQKEDFMLSSIIQDVRYALRGMRRAPGFSLMVLATLTLGIGASVATYSAVHAVLLKPLPYREPDRIVRLDHVEPYGTVSEPEFVDYRREMTSMASIAGFTGGKTTLMTRGEEPERINALWVSDGFFETLGAPLFMGHAFSPQAEKRRGPWEAVISHGLWKRRFGGDTGIVGKQLLMGGRQHTIVGVMAPGAEFPRNDISVWTPLRINYDTLWTRNNHYMTVIGRLKSGIGAEHATAEMNTLATRFVRDFPDVYDPKKPLKGRVAHLASLTVADVKPYLMTLFGAVIFVLLIACVNVANLLLARGEARRKELAIRSAMGASGFRVARQAFTESLLFAVGGGTLGVGLAACGVWLLRAVAPANIPRIEEITLDGGVLFFALGITLGTGLLFGMMPAMRSTRHDSADTLREGGKTSGSARGLGRLRRTLVMAEVALSVVTLSGAGLMLRSLWNMQAIDLGFRPDGVLAVQVAPPQNYTDEQSLQLYQRLAVEARAIAGVVGTGAVEELPITDGNSDWSILIDNAPMTSVANSPSAMPQKVTPGYFETMRIPLIRGRVFDATDVADGALVAVVNETMAKQMWPGKDAIGGQVKLLNEQMPRATVVGIVKDVKSTGILGKVPPTMYFVTPQAKRVAWYIPQQMWFLVRVDGDPAALAPQLRALVRRVEPLAAIATIQTMEQAVSNSVASRRFATALIAGFATMALLLAGIGIFGVVAYSVNQRQFEIGLRLALGATPRMVVGQILGEGVRTTAIGAGLGLLIALGATRSLSAMFVAVTPADPVTMVAVTALLVLVALAASYVPARRASVVDPLSAIRAE